MTKKADDVSVQDLILIPSRVEDFVSEQAARRRISQRKEILRGVDPERRTPMLRSAQHDTKRRAQDDRIRCVQPECIPT